jgi:glycosyltransferase involved in cell wall biosynthesis
MSMRVAVLVPCHDDGTYVIEAVRSVREAEEIELVVVDDASRDPATIDALAELERDGVRVVRVAKNVGVPEARMIALRQTSAPYVFPLDADDELLPGALARMADRLDADPDAAVCFGDYVEFGVQQIVRSVPQRLDPYRVAYSNDWGASMFRRSVLEQVGGWLPDGHDGRTFPYEDWHVWMSLAERGERGVYMGPGFVTYRRRIQAGRRLSSDRRRHAQAVQTLRALHPGLYTRIREHRRRSELGSLQKALYPVIYGRRPRLPFEQRLRYWFDRAGVGPDRLLGRR